MDPMTSGALWEGAMAMEPEQRIDFALAVVRSTERREVVLSEDEAEKLEEAIADYRANPDSGIAWDQAMAQIGARLQ
jgi:hypothetical protein